MATQEFYSNNYHGTNQVQQSGVTAEIIDPNSRGGDTITITALGASTYPSKPVTQINIPEPSSVEANFEYVYFMQDEKENQSENQISAVINQITEDELAFLSTTDRIPRFVKVTFTPPEFDTLTAQTSSPYMDSIFSSTKVSEHAHNLMFEQAMSNAIFSSVSMMDTGIDTTFYTALSSSAVFSGFTGDIADQLSNSVSSVNGSVRTILKNPQAMGITFSESDTRESVVLDPLSSVRNLQFNFTVNNLVFGNLINGSTGDSTNAYGDEIAGILTTAVKVQQHAAKAGDSTHVDESDFEPLVTPISQEIVTLPGNASDDRTKLQSMNEGSVLVGFYVEKFEIEQDGNLKRMKGIPIDSPNITSFIDPVVRYGGAYLYKVHAVSLSRVEVIRIDASGGTGDQVVMANVLIASEGANATAICTESVPPPPPTDIRFKYDFGNDNLIIFWEFPINSQRDIKRFQIFKRTSVSQPFTILREYNFDNSTVITPPLERVPPTIVTEMTYPKKSFTDTQFTKDSTAIYTLASVDAHGLSSGYSLQFSVSFDRFKNKLNVETISRSGAPKPYPNIYMSGDVFVDTMKDSGHTRIKLYFDPEFSMVTQETSAGDTTIVHQLPPGGSSTGETPSYKLQIINTDLQQSRIVDIHLADSRTPASEVQGSSADVRTLALLE